MRSREWLDRPLPTQLGCRASGYMASAFSRLQRSGLRGPPQARPSNSSLERQRAFYSSAKSSAWQTRQPAPTRQRRATTRPALFESNRPRSSPRAVPPVARNAERSDLKLQSFGNSLMASSGRGVAVGVNLSKPTPNAAGTDFDSGPLVRRRGKRHSGAAAAAASCSMHLSLRRL